MSPKRYSIYSSETLESALAGRLPHGDTEAGMRSRSSTITAMVDRYAETCRRSMPRMPLASWLLIFDAMNGCWMMDHPAMVASGLALNVADACAMNGYHEKWKVDDWRDLVENLRTLPFAGQIAVVDACERFWCMDVQTSDAEPTETDPWAHWREAVRSLVGPMTDDAQS